MEEIFNKPLENGKKGEIIGLHKQGLNNNQIAIKLNLSRQYVGRVLSDVTSCNLDVNQNTPECNLDVTNAPQGTPLTNIDIEQILKEFESNLLEKVQSTIETRIQTTLNYYVKNHLDGVITSKVREFTRGND